MASSRPRARRECSSGCSGARSRARRGREDGPAGWAGSVYAFSVAGRLLLLVAASRRDPLAPGGAWIAADGPLGHTPVRSCAFSPCRRSRRGPRGPEGARSGSLAEVRGWVP